MKTENSADRLALATQNLAFNDSISQFTSALQDVIKETSSVSAIAEEEELSRPNIHRILAGDVDPRLQTVSKMLNALGLTLTIAKKDNVDRLHPRGLFASLDIKSLRDLEAEGIFSDVARGEVLVKQNSRPTWFIVLLSGEASVYDETRSDDRILGTLKAGDVIGELSLIDSNAAAATVKVTEDAKIWKIKRTKINTYWKSHPATEAKMKHELLKVLAERLRKTNQIATARKTRTPDIANFG